MFIALPINDLAHICAEHLPGGNGVMDSALACCAGGPGSIPAIGIVELQYSDDFSPSRSNVVGYGTRLDNWHDLAFPE